MTRPAHVTFIHGLANKPPAVELRRIWLEALGKPMTGDGGFDLGAVGVTASFVYWADLFYDEPLPPGEYENNAGELESSFPSDVEVEDSRWLKDMQAKFPDEFEDAPFTEADSGYERVPLPRFIKKRIMRHFVREAHDYLWNVDGIQDKIRERVMDDFAKVPQGTDHVLFGHSQGTFIAYDVLTGVEECKEIEGFMTVGSPLGVDEIQDRLAGPAFPTKVKGDWVNVYDPYDPVSRPDPVLANDFKKGGEEAVIDVKEENWGTWRHSASKYYQGIQLRQHLRRLCGREGV